VNGKFFSVFAWRNARRHKKSTAEIILRMKSALLANILDFFLRCGQKFGGVFYLDF
jgi:hypothetical protein